MSLLDDYITSTGKCVMLDIHREPDGYGGFSENYVESVEFDAAIVQNNSIQAQIAEKQSISAFFTVTTSKNISLKYHDIFKRKSDNKIFRVTSGGDSNQTPPSSSLNMRQVSAESYTLPDTNT